MRTRVIREMAICGFVFVAATVLRGQLLYPDPGTRPSFEVATVKQGHGAGQLYDLRLQPDRFWRRTRRSTGSFDSPMT